MLSWCKLVDTIDKATCDHISHLVLQRYRAKYFLQDCLNASFDFIKDYRINSSKFPYITSVILIWLLVMQ